MAVPRREGRHRGQSLVRHSLHLHPDGTELVVSDGANVTWINGIFYELTAAVAAIVASAAVLGALITTWSTFLPCYLFVFLGAPHVEHLSPPPAIDTTLPPPSAA